MNYTFMHPKRVVCGAFLAILLLLLLSSCEKDAKLSPRVLEHPLVFIGMDGAEWSVMEPMLARGELPNFQKLMDQGIHSGIINPGAMISPPIWTTYITGEHPRLHGILDHTFPYNESKSKQPVNSTMRLKPTLWNIASDAGLRSAIVGYFVSWPAEDIFGTIISDRAMQQFEDSVFPESQRAMVDEIVDQVSSKSGRKDFLSRYYPWGYRMKQASDPDNQFYAAARLIIGRADRPFLNDEVMRRSALALQTDAYDFVSVYLRSADLASHSFWREYDDTGFSTPADPQLKELLGGVIPETYRFLDEALGNLMEKFGPNANYLVVSDHGFHSAGKELVVANKFHSVLTGNHLPVGIFIAAGPDFRTQKELPEGWQVTSLDIMPTMARLLQLPVASNLTGDVLEVIMTQSFLEANDLVSTSVYELDGFARPYNSADKVKQTQEMSSLSGLGYVGGDTTAGISDLEKYDFWNAKDDLLTGHTSGEIIDALLHQKYPLANSILLRFMQKRPDLEKKLMHAIRIRLSTLSKSDYLITPVDGQKILKKFRRRFNQSHPGVILLWKPKV